MLRIQVRKLLFDDAYLSKVVDDKKSWFTWMAVLELMYHQSFSTPNTFWQQRTTSQFFQPLPLQTLALVIPAIHCALSEYATGKKVTVLFSQDEYQGKFYHSTVIWLYYCRSHFTTHQLHMVGYFVPPSPSPMVLLRLNMRTIIPVSTPQSGLPLQYIIQRSSILAPTSILSCSVLFQTLYLPPHFAMLSMGGCSPGSALLNPHRCSFAWLCSAQLHSALLHQHEHSPCPPWSPHQALLFSWWRTAFSSEFIILPFKPCFDSLQANVSIPTIEISQMKQNNIGIQFQPLAMLDLFGNTRSVSSFYAQLMNCMCLHLLALIRWEI